MKNSKNNDDLERRDQERRKHDSARSRDMRIWLGILTMLWVATAVTLSFEYNSLQSQNAHFKQSRIESKTQSCELDAILLGVIHNAKADALGTRLQANYKDCVKTLKIYEDQR